MTSNRRLARWSTLALLVAAMSGCCIAPWGGPGRYDGGGYHDGGPRYGGEHGPGPGGDWHR